MTADKLIQSLFDYHPNKDTEVCFLLLDDDGSTKPLEVVDVARNADCSGDNSLGIIVRLNKGENLSRLQKLKLLREETGAGLKEAHNALEYANWELPRARDYLKYGW